MGEESQSLGSRAQEIGVWGSSGQEGQGLGVRGSRGQELGVSRLRVWGSGFGGRGLGLEGTARTDPTVSRRGLSCSGKTDLSPYSCWRQPWWCWDPWWCGASSPPDRAGDSEHPLLCPTSPRNRQDRAWLGAGTLLLQGLGSLHPQERTWRGGGALLCCLVPQKAAEEGAALGWGHLWGGTFLG